MLNKSILIAFICLSISSCKDDTKEQLKVVGTNEDGATLVVNAKGDTIVQTEALTEDIKDNKDKEAFIKGADGLYSFQFNLEKGKKYPFVLKSTSEVSQSDGQKSQSMSQSSTTAMSYKVSEVKPESYVLDVTFERFAENLKSGKESIAYDTDEVAPTKEGAKENYKFNKAIVGKTFKMEVEKDGTVKHINNLFSVRQDIKEDLKPELSPEEFAALDQLLQQTLNDNAMNMMFVESVSYYPKKPVTIGESWTKEDKLGNATSKITYTLEEVNDQNAIITIKGSSKGSDSNTMENGVKVFTSIDGSVDGKATINAKSGWVDNADISRSETQRMTQEFQGQKRNMSSTTNSTTEIN